jgi:6-phosphogluconolactonase
MSELVFVGTYTRLKPKDRAPSEGIYAFEYDAKRGTLSPLGATGGIENPSFVITHPNGKYLYAVIEVGQYEGKRTGAVAAFSIDRKTGGLKEINRRISHGGAPCHLACDPQGAFLFVSNYSGGSMAMYPLEKNGALGKAGDIRTFVDDGPDPDKNKKWKSHAHSVLVDVKGRYVLCQDLGFNKVWQFKLDRERGRLIPNDPVAFAAPAGSGPRHAALHPNGNFVYVIGEKGSVMTACRFDADKGTLTEIHTVSTLPRSFKKRNSCADVHVSPSGKFLYGSNRGHDSIVIYRIDEKTGRIALVGHVPSGGRTPRNFAISPDGHHLFAAHQNSHNILAFLIDNKTGRLEHTGETNLVSAPVCIHFAGPMA